MFLVTDNYRHPPFSQIFSWPKTYLLIQRLPAQTNHRNGSYQINTIIVSRERFALLQHVVKFRNFFLKNVKKCYIYTRKGGVGVGKSTHSRKLHPCRLFKIVNQSRILTMGQVTCGQKRMVKLKIALLRPPVTWTMVKILFWLPTFRPLYIYIMYILGSLYSSFSYRFLQLYTIVYIQYCLWIWGVNKSVPVDSPRSVDLFHR